MIVEMIQSVLAYYCDVVLYGSIGWFGVIGFLTHSCVIVAVTRLPYDSMVVSLARFHLMSLIFSTLSAPVLAVLSCNLLKILLHDVQPGFDLVCVYVWFGLSMAFFSTYFLCSFLVSVSCKTFQKILIFTDGMLILIGYFVLKGLTLVQ